MKVIVLALLAVTQCVLALPNSEYRGLQRDQRDGLAADASQREERGRMPDPFDRIRREGKANTPHGEPLSKNRDGRLLLFSPGDDSLYKNYYGLYAARRYYTPGDYFNDYSYAAVGKFPYSRKGILSGSNYNVYL